MKEFFGIGEYTRTPEGYMSWQHLTFVSLLMVLMVGLAVWLGIRNRKAEDRAKNKVLIIAAILIDTIEIFKIIMISYRGGDAFHWMHELPLFLCSIQLITIPLAAFSKGRVRESALDFVSIFGIVGAVLGTIGAGQNYNAYPVLSIDNVASGITHSISGFCSLYILIAGLASMKKKNIAITFGILTGFCAAAYVTNRIIDYNYMFLMAPDGTPYEIIYSLVGGHSVLYPLAVWLLFIIYITGFYGIYYLCTKKKAPQAEK